jgi:ATP-dependent protease HslVU (ClpYQ) peptidase subunit
MTTICYKDGILCSDSQMTSGGTVQSYNTVKLHRLPGGWIGGCGGISDFSTVLEFLRGNIEELPKGLSFAGLYMKDNGECCVVESCAGGYIRELVCHTFYAIGSGGDFAMGAMAAGASAKEAVKIAIKHDIYSGGRIRMVKRGQKK